MNLKFSTAINLAGKKSTEEAIKAKSDAFWLNKNVNVFDDVSCLIGNNRKEPVGLDDGVA